jgi:proline iminopeptidase
MNDTAPPDALHAPQEPYATGMLDVGDGHSVYYEQCGQPQGLPIVVLHGGPGSSFSARHRQLFDLQRYRVVLFDQRGCGRSLPRGRVQANTSDHLVADIEQLRQHLGVESWLVVGGSWGAGLALAYAAAHPAACKALVLRGVFLGRASDLDWFFQQAQQQLPDAWAALAQQAPPAARTHLMHWLCTSVSSGQPQEALAAACAWDAWETAMSQRKSTPPADAMRGASPAAALPTGDAAQALLEKFRVQSHYLMHGCFWDGNDLLARASALGAVPTAIVHGRLDWICLPQAAWELHQNLPGSRLQWLDGCGHSAFEPAMARAMADAIAHYAIHGQFAGWGSDFSKAGTP